MPFKNLPRCFMLSTGSHKHMSDLRVAVNASPSNQSTRSLDQLMLDMRRSFSFNCWPNHLKEYGLYSLFLHVTELQISVRRLGRAQTSRPKSVNVENLTPRISSLVMDVNSETSIGKLGRTEGASRVRSNTICKETTCVSLRASTYGNDPRTLTRAPYESAPMSNSLTRSLREGDAVIKFENLPRSCKLETLTL